MSQVTENPTYDIDVGETSEAVDVDISESGEATVAEKDPAPLVEIVADSKKAEDNSGELKDYSQDVQKRISKLTSKLREAERRETAAIEYAKGVQNQFQQASQRANQSDRGRLEETKKRVDSQLMTIKQIIKKAREEGDIDTETEAQERLSTLAYEQRQLNDYLQQPPPAQPQQIYQQPQFAPQQQQPQADPKAEAWASENSWFGEDYTMTYAAWGIDKQLREVEGFDGSTDEYYDELNRRVKAQFPQKFSATQPRQQRQPVQSVAAATRSSGVNSARRSVRLTPSQVAIAKKLGVPVEEYAKYVKE